MNETAIKQAIHDLLYKGLELDPGDHNFTDTPARVAKVYAELFRPADTEWPVFDENYSDFTLFKGYEFYTLCPHHLLPVRIVGSLAYIPNGKVVGLSKLGRVMLDANRAPMTQELLTQRILDRFQALTHGTAPDVAVHLQGDHGCTKMRGLRANGASMITEKLTGRFRTEPELISQFRSLVQAR